MSSFRQMCEMMDRIMEDCIREMHRTSNQSINAVTSPAYWRDGRSVLQAANEAHQIVNDENKFAISLDVSQFKPEELKVNRQGRTLTVEGKQENKGENSFMARSFMRSWTLPEDVKLEEVKSELTDKGRLTIEVPKYPDPSYRKDYKEIPIEHRGSSSSQSQSTHTYTHSRSGH